MRACSFATSILCYRNEDTKPLEVVGLLLLQGWYRHDSGSALSFGANLYRVSPTCT